MSEFEDPDEAECWAEARKLITQYGGEVQSHLRIMIDVCRDEGEWELYHKWTTVRNCVAMILNGPDSATLQ
jgi:hypothetical protein